MAFPRHGTPATRLAQDLGTMLGDFTAQVDVLLTHPTVGAAMSLPQIRREVCVAVWAALTAALEASVMSQEEKDRIAALVREDLLPIWQRHCASDPEVAGLISERASDYLANRDPRSQVATATHIVRRLLDRIGAGGREERRLTKTLIPLFAHRILGDTHHINDLKARIGSRLPLLATLCVTTAGFTSAIEPTLRMLRLT